MITTFIIHLLAFLHALGEFRRNYSTGLSIERARAGFLADLRDGYTPEQIFLLSMRQAGRVPGSPAYLDMRDMVKGFARAASVGWQQTLKEALR